MIPHSSYRASSPGRWQSDYIVRGAFLERTQTLTPESGKGYTRLMH
jgi:hypothetical protein